MCVCCLCPRGEDCTTRLGVTYPGASNQRDAIQGPDTDAFPLVALHPDQPRGNRMRRLVQLVSATHVHLC